MHAQMRVHLIRWDFDSFSSVLHTRARNGGTEFHFTELLMLIFAELPRQRHRWIKTAKPSLFNMFNASEIL
jgi:hypothetical protein